jgi:hypothetical protein
VKSLVELSKVLLLDCGRKCGAPVWRSVETLIQRVKHEGDSFITITLPSFCQNFERSLDSGRVDPGSFPNFRKKKGTTGIPAFLSEFLLNVFGADGALLDNPSVDCIRAIRQFCLFAKKIERPCDEARNLDAIERYIQCDCEVTETLPDNQISRYFAKTGKILTDLLGLDEISIADLVPKHGPGATREGISGNQKYNHEVWHERLESCGFTWLKFGHSSDIVTEWELRPNNLPILVEPGSEQPCRVTLVPKTMKTPRVIAVEPVCMQYTQQALSRFLVERLNSCSITAGHVNFTDQEVNKKLALRSSQDGKYATLDMKDASDRVSIGHTSHMLGGGAGKFLRFALACRSGHAELPSGEVLRLSKFASMGSALCFPIEAMVFFTSIIASRVCRAGLFPTLHTVQKYSRDVYVYGDDLIVPADEAPAICDDLEALGFKVNRRKSFWTGKFRESCGSDCYDGTEVTPVYLRRDLPTCRGEISMVLSAVATANQLEKAGYHRVSGAIRDSVEKTLGRKLPTVSPDSPAIGWHGHSEVVPDRRWNRWLMRLEERHLTVVTTRRPDPLEGYGALVKSLLSCGCKTVSSAADHLEFSPSRYGLALKRRWVPVT